VWSGRYTSKRNESGLRWVVVNDHNAL
jgi:hypothetical protein